MIILFLLIVFAYYVGQHPRLHRRAILEKEGVFLDCDMSAKFRELLDDPTMTRAKWLEWLPVFEAADAEVRKKCPNLPLGQQAKLVRMIINDGDIEPQLI